MQSVTTADNPPTGFYVVAREPGAENPAIPTWANRGENPLALTTAYRQVERIAVDCVPGAFQLLNVLSAQECEALIALGEKLGFLADAAVSLPRSVRHNDNVVWVVDDATQEILWRRVSAAINADTHVYQGDQALGLNARFRFYRYGVGDYFQFHSDGAWPGSRVIGGELVSNAFDDRYSQASFLFYLNGDYEGGATRFLVNASDASLPVRRGDPVREVDVRTPAGGVLCFPHGAHPLHCVHSSEPIISGVKYIIRTDLLLAW